MKFIIPLFLLTFSVLAQSSFDEATQLFNQKKFIEAKVYFDAYLKTHPTDAKTIQYLGDIASNQKNWDEAIKLYELLKTQNPTVANYWYKYGGAMGLKAQSSNKFKALKMLDEIETSFLTAAKLDSKHIDSRWALVMFYAQVPGILGGSETKSQKFANELMTISPIDGYLADGYIAEYYKRYNAAYNFYSKAYEIGKSKIAYQKLYSLCLNKLKDSEKAKKLKEQFEK